MPELPEVETVVRGLQHLAGQTLHTIEVFDARVWFESELKPSAFHAQRLSSIARRGKYLLFRFESGISLVGHLRMTGKFLAETSPMIPEGVRAVLGQKKGKALQARTRFRFERDSLIFLDTRRFGTLTAVKSEAAYFALKKIAPDPIENEEQARAVFLASLESKKKPIKALLLDQSAIAGVGNIYADEALHAVGIHPARVAAKVKDPLALWDAILRLLNQSILAGGTTVYNYLNADGKRGENSQNLLVYGRTGEPCQACGKPIQRIQLAGRSTHFCANCQRKSVQSRAP
ncbi:MAG: bifunctional DNA-formamidopyrimidine glycosylase/DNA-(apurinic or apyrimidinic site) lyase [Bdellovibrionota bacterium]